MKSHSRLLVLTADHSEVAEPDWCTGSRERRGHMLDLASGIAVRGLPWWIEEGYEDETAPRWTLRGQVFGGGFLLVDLHCPERSPAHRDGRVYSVLVMAQESEYPVGAVVAIMQSRTADKVNNLPVRPRVPWAAVLIRRSDWERASEWLPSLVVYLAYGWLEVCEEMEPLIQELEWYAVVERLAGLAAQAIRPRIVTDQKECERCGGSMEGRHANAKYCPLCKQEVKRERRRERQRRRRQDPEWRKKEHAKRRAKRARARAEREATVEEATKRERRCGDCGTDISDRGSRSTRCVACQAERRRQLERERYRQAEGIAEERRCKECGESIADRHARARYCESCAELRKTKGGRRYMRQRRQDPAFRRRMSENWPCRRHLVELLVEQKGRCGICGKPMPADAIESWVVGRIVPESAGGRREKENCQVVHLKCSGRKGGAWEGSREAQVAKWAPWKLRT